MQVAGSDVIHSLDKNLLRFLPFSLEDLDPTNPIPLPFSSASTLPDVQAALLSETILGDGDGQSEVLSPSTMYSVFSKYNVRVRYHLGHSDSPH